MYGCLSNRLSSVLIVIVYIPLFDTVDHDMYYFDFSTNIYLHVFFFFFFYFSVTVPKRAISNKMRSLGIFAGATVKWRLDHEQDGLCFFQFFMLASECTKQM